MDDVLAVEVGRVHDCDTAEVDQPLNVAEFPEPTDTVALGVRVTVLGERSAVNDALELLTKNPAPVT